MAAAQGHAAAVQVLLARGAAVDARSLAMATPLHVAARFGHAAVAALLRARGALPAGDTAR
jgi:ankyrin repeat protein